jgi:hypothetical protein
MTPTKIRNRISHRLRHCLRPHGSIDGGNHRLRRRRALQKHQCRQTLLPSSTYITSLLLHLLLPHSPLYGLMKEHGAYGKAPTALSSTAFFIAPSHLSCAHSSALCSVYQTPGPVPQHSLALLPSQRLTSLPPRLRFSPWSPPSPLPALLALC